MKPGPRPGTNGLGISWIRPPMAKCWRHAWAKGISKATWLSVTSMSRAMAETRGTLNLAVPAVVSNTLLRKISAEMSYQRPRSAMDARHRLEAKLLDCGFEVELSAAHLPVSLQALADITPGTVLTFPRNAATPAMMMVEDVRLCTAMAARVNSRRAGRVVELAPLSTPEGIL